MSMLWFGVSQCFSEQSDFLYNFCSVHLLVLFLVLFLLSVCFAIEYCKSDYSLLLCYVMYALFG